MKAKLKKLAGSQAEIEILIEPEKLSNFREQALVELSRELEAPGFRKGKLPATLAEKMIDRERLAQSALSRALAESYRRAVADFKLETVGPAKADLVSAGRDNELVFRVSVEVLPQFELPDYKSIAEAVKRRRVELSAAELNSALQWLQKSRAKKSQVVRPARADDFVEIEYSLSGFPAGRSHRDGFILGQGRLLPGFEEQIAGMTAGQTKKFRLSFPADHKEPKLAGQEVEITLILKAVQQIELPVLNDDFAKALGRSDGLETLKQSIAAGLQTEKEQAESQRVRQEIVDKIAAAAGFEPPPALVAAEAGRMLADLEQGIAQRFKTSLEEYLKSIKSTKEQMLQSFKDSAGKKVKHFLIVSAVAKARGIEVLPEEVEQQINQHLRDYRSATRAQKELEPERLKEYYKTVIAQEKTLKFLESLAGDN